MTIKISAFALFIGIIVIVWGLSIGWDSTFGSPERDAMALRILIGTILFVGGFIAITAKRSRDTARLPHP